MVADESSLVVKAPPDKRGLSNSSLGELEAVIERGLETFVDVGLALLAIRDRRLYRENHATFDDYCRERWGFSRIRAHQLIEGAEVAGLLTTVNGPTNEAQARELVPLLREDEQEVVEVWRELKRDHGDKVTADLVRQAVGRKLARKELPQITEPIVVPAGKFSCIVVDPPWPYSNRAYDESHQARNPYMSLGIEDIKALEIPAADDCILWLWTTNAFMHDAYHVLEAWGFEPKTILTWGKDKMGLGDWLRGQTEHCILAVRGHPSVNLTNQTTLLRGPRREHSRKPDEFYNLAEALCGGPRLEMFARQRRDGWEVFGNEPDRFS